MMQEIKLRGVWTALAYPGDTTGSAKEIHVEDKTLSFEFTVWMENALWDHYISV